jgi:ABC-type antimicrobial peptide transport system permease subunit
MKSTMKLSTLIEQVIWGILHRPAISAALLVSLAIIIFSLTFSYAVSKSFEKEITLLSFGPYARSLVIRENVLEYDRFGPPELSDMAFLQKNLKGLEKVAAWRQFPAELAHGRERKQIMAYGVDGAYEDELGRSLKSGRLLTSGDLRVGKRNCLIGYDLAHLLKLKIHQDVSINGVKCKIVGVLAEPETRIQERFAGAVILSAKAAARFYDIQSGLLSTQVTWVTAIGDGSSSLDSLAAKADKVLRRKYGIPQSQASAFTYTDPNTSLRSIVQQSTLISRLLAILSTIGILAGAISYLSLLTATMKQREQEFAIRRLVGATNRNLFLQIYMEVLIIFTLAAALSFGLLLLGLSVIESLMNSGGEYSPRIVAAQIGLLFVPIIAATYFFSRKFVSGDVYSKLK